MNVGPNKACHSSVKKPLQLIATTTLSLWYVSHHQVNRNYIHSSIVPSELRYIIHFNQILKTHLHKMLILFCHFTGELSSKDIWRLCEKNIQLCVGTAIGSLAYDDMPSSLSYRKVCASTLFFPFTNHLYFFYLHASYHHVNVWTSHLPELIK